MGDWQRGRGLIAQCTLVIGRLYYDFYRKSVLQTDVSTLVRTDYYCLSVNCDSKNKIGKLKPIAITKLDPNIRFSSANNETYP